MILFCTLEKEMRHILNKSFELFSSDGQSTAASLCCLPMVAKSLSKCCQSWRGKHLFNFSASNSDPDNNYQSFSLPGPEPGNWYMMAETEQDGEQQGWTKVATIHCRWSSLHAEKLCSVSRGGCQGWVHHGDQHHHHPHLQQLSRYQDLLNRWSSANIQV